jgi:hypothetical protein
MPYFVCPNCKDPEKTVRVEVASSYEPDTNAGGAPEITAVECGCDLTPGQQAVVYAEADRIPAEDYWVHVDDVW